jgi:Photosynthetic reaction centre cytochrome C subunit
LDELIKRNAGCQPASVINKNRMAKTQDAGRLPAFRRKKNMKTKIKIIAISTFALFALTFFAPIGETQTKTDTAAQKFKSIKVLNDMPSDQMGKVMNQMSSSLGVNCAFCHASNDGDYEKEGNEHKNTAREMITMTFELNKKYFNGRPEINCNSCHNGKSHPQPSFPLVAAKPAEGRPKQPAKLPTIDEILMKYETALGGKAKIAKVTSRQIKSQRIEPDGKTMEAEEMWQKADKSRIDTTYGKTIISETFDGTIVSKTSDGAKIDLQADESDNIKRDAQIFANPDLKKIYAQMDVRFFDKIDGREVWTVQATTADKKRENLVFDATTGFLVRRSASTRTVLGNFVYQVNYEDYKDFGGVKLPTTMKFAVPGIYWTRKILDVKNNVNIDDAKFSGK